MKSEQQAFKDAIRQTPCDETLRLIYADWLEEHNMPKEAAEQRDWRNTSRKWMLEFAKQHHAYGKYHNWEEEMREDTKDTEQTQERYCDQFLEFLQGHVDGRGRFGFDIPYDFREYSDEMWEHFEALTGQKPQECYRGEMPENFSCAC